MKKNNIDKEELHEDNIEALYDNDSVDESAETNDDNVSENGDKSPLDELQEKYDNLNNNYLRLHAEFDNFRKRTVKEKADLIKGGGERVLVEILPFADDFERALQSVHSAEDKAALVEGMDLIYAKFVEFLKQHGVTEIEAVGQPFDAELFEAVTTIPAPEEAQRGTVVDCIQKGYYLNDKIIRFPKVIVGE